MRRLRGLLLLLAAPFASGAAADTEAPAHRVTDFLVLSVGGRVQLQGSPALIGNTLYFPAQEQFNPAALWASNGATDDAHIIETVSAQSPVALGGQAYFLGAKGGVWSVWETDGTAAGTRPLAELGAGGLPRNLTAAGNLLYFVGLDDRPWRTDGSAGGTDPLATAEVSDSTAPFVEALDAVFFIAVGQDGQLGLWRTRGSPQTTRLVAGLGAAAGQRYGYGIAEVGNRVVFVTSQGDGSFRLWSSDGSAAGTAPLRNFSGEAPGPCPNDCQPAGPTPPVTIGDVVVFFAHDGVTGRELWISDGTPGGTSLAADINPTGSSDGGGLEKLGPVSLSGPYRLFAADDGVHGMELWRTDGTPAGTSLLTDIVAGPGSSHPFAFVAVGDATFFSANGAIWRSDGTPGGTTPFRQTSAAPSPITGGFTFVNAQGLWRSNGSSVVRVDDLSAVRGLFPVLLTDAGGTLFFSRLEPDDSVESIWRSDGTEDGTDLLQEFRLVSNLGGAGGRLYFGADDGINGLEPWSSDGTAAGTRLLRNIAIPSPGGAAIVDSFPADFTSAGGRVFFSARDVPHGVEVWSTDGTGGGTLLTDDLTPGPGSSSPDWLTEFQGQVFFATSSPRALWRAAAGSAPVRVRDVNAQRLTAAGSTLFFVGTDTEHGSELWKTDGTEDGTTRVLDIVPGPGSPTILSLVPAGRILFFEVQSASGETLWRSDGTEAGTFVVREFGGIDWLTASGARVLFSAFDAEHGFELWVSDGTDAGTALVRDILPGAPSSEPSWLAAVEGVVLFAAEDPDHGRELWLSDGTTGGTRLVQDIFPGPAWSGPAEIRRSGSQVFFRANDEEAGSQLWALPVSAIQTDERPRRNRVPQVITRD